MTRQPEDDLVVVAIYGYRHEAELRKSMLEANAVAAMISGDDFGGVQPMLGAANGVRLLVNRCDESLARKLLAV